MQEQLFGTVPPVWTAVPFPGVTGGVTAPALVTAIAIRRGQPAGPTSDTDFASAIAEHAHPDQFIDRWCGAFALPGRGGKFRSHANCLELDQGIDRQPAVTDPIAAVVISAIAVGAFRAP